ncbi:MAG: hypothetical protein LCH60_14955, partial [Actinobacteria bacterium]|nr:hypothetical protein [Actinomycetota bacterium]
MPAPDISEEALAKRYPALFPALTPKAAPASKPTKAIPGPLVQQCLRDAVPLLHEGAEEVLWSLVDRAKVLDANGNERLVRQLVGVKLASVFDVSQVDPAPPPRPEATLLKGQAPPGLWDSLIEFAAKEGFNVERGPCGRANGFIDFEGHFIRVRDDIDELAQTKTLVHEIGHGLTMGPAERLTYAQRGCRGIREVEAESIAYVVLQAHDVDSSGYTFNYVAGWATQAAGGDSAKIDQVIHATGEKVIAAAHRILAHTQPDATAEGDLIDARAGEVLMLIAPAVPGGTREQASGGPVPKWETVTAPTLG